MRVRLLALSLAACAAPEPAPVAPTINVQPQPWQPMPSPEPMPPQPAPANTLTGTIGGKPFVAQSAVLVRVNESADASSSDFPGKTFPIVWSFLFVFDRPMGCADVGKNLAPNADRYLRYQVQGRWPLSDGTSYGVGGDPHAPAADGFAGNVWHGSSGSVLHGMVRIVRASIEPAVLDMDVSTMTSGTETSGALRGSVAVTICR